MSSISPPPPPPESAGRGSLVAVRLKPELRGAPFATLAADARVEQLQFAAEALQHHLGRVAIGAALVLPFARLQLALEVNFRALLAILLGDLAEVFV
jgi:hypothetical protein